MNAYPDWLSMKEIDQSMAVSKGTSFRRFKQWLPQLVQGRDYLVLNANADAAAISALKRTGRIYSSSVQVVLLSTAAATAIHTSPTNFGG